MRYQADFKDGKILFEEVLSEARDMTKLQAGMFTDRPDLWQPKRRTKRQNPQQSDLFSGVAR